MATADLPAGDVLVRVHYSNVNYKDGLAIMRTGHRQIVGHFPFVPGVDFSGIVETSDSRRFAPGDKVILTGWGVGESQWGGFAEMARVRSEWLVPLPDGMSLRQSMALGSAGLAAMMCVEVLERFGIDRSREVLVTGAAGGVGSVAVMLLHKLGFTVVGSTRRPGEGAYLRMLGADRIVDAATLAQPPAEPLMEERWGAAIDNVGGTTLANLLASIIYGGAIASIGLVGGRDLNTTVIPFIRRNIALLGIDTVYTPAERRTDAWRRLAKLLPDGLSEEVIDEIPLEQVPARAAAVMRGELRGRTIVSLAD
ncbi:acrylyl-CoA reductase family protein [Bosea sp. TAB14]|uniref:acrylyl-CoA reductase family protein n=1 Tax=Bosea sp. TAB14 TaxID=3237481 RepID=UPI003F905084